MADFRTLSEPPRDAINLADSRLGATALSASDEFFAPKERMLQSGEPEWRAGVYDDHGKWMDGWEPRRRRDSGHDHCIVKLAAPGVLTALDVDTRHFTGNYPPYASVEACRMVGTSGAEAERVGTAGANAQGAATPRGTTPSVATSSMASGVAASNADPRGVGATWVELLPYVPLKGNQRNLFAVTGANIWTHLRLNIFPDGGVARLRAYGAVHREWQGETACLDLAAALNGGRALACSDEHYGSRHNLLLPGRGASMADGWETRRRREPGYDWVILQLGHPGRIRKVEIDTAHFKGNFPHQVSIQGALLEAVDDADLTSRCLYWPTLLEPQLLQADHIHAFEAQLQDLGPISHARVNMHPDGGMSRVRLFGQPERV
jgi:allantoicase